MKLYELENHINNLLNVSRFRDYAPNGLQVEGKTRVQCIVTGVTACQALLDAAVEQQADAILVHHGYFWKNEDPVLRGMKKRRIATLLRHDMSLFAYHLPLDAHPELGNNARLGHLLGIENMRVMDPVELQGVGNIGTLPEPITLEVFAAKVGSVLQRDPLVIAGGSQKVSRVAWCSGGAQGYIQEAATLGADVYLSGEISEHTVHAARENGIHYIAAGHHATERYGVKALGEHLARQFGLKHVFIDINNPA